MPETLRCEHLPVEQAHLLNHFYRQHRSRMRAGAEQQPWVLRDSTVLACLCLQPLQSGHWLTGLFVAPQHRHLGLATQLLNSTRSQVSGPLWLFCAPEFEALYSRCGYHRTTELPESLTAKLQRYLKSKPLLAMVHQG